MTKDTEKVLLFDLGGVIMDIRCQDCIDAMARLGMDNPGQFLGEYGQKGPFLALEKGEITPAEFHRELRRYFPEGVTDGQIDEAFNEFLIGIPAERLRRLEQLHRSHRIYMLSNTNPIMWHDKISREFRKLGKDVNYYFDGCVLSFDVKAYKPDAGIFRIVLERFGLKPEQVVFFDDSAANCEAARRLGFEAIHVAPGTEFYNLIPEADASAEAKS